ncbi:hypothetical protein D3C84_1138820 [compost metagenome]
MKARIPRPSTKNRMKVPNLPALDFFARSQTIKPMKPIRMVTRMVIIHSSNNAGSIDTLRQVEARNYTPRLQV